MLPINEEHKHASQSTAGEQLHSKVLCDDRDLRLMSKEEIQPLSERYCDEVILREYESHDESSIDRIVRHAAVAPWLFGADFRWCLSVRETNAARLKSRKDIRWTAVEGRTQSVIGGARLIGCELSYFVKRELWGRGYGSAIARQACHFAEVYSSEPLKLHIHRENIRSRKIAERLGFRFMGIVIAQDGLPTLHYQRRGASRQVAD